MEKLRSDWSETIQETIQETKDPLDGKQIARGCGCLWQHILHLLGKFRNLSSM